MKRAIGISIGVIYYGIAFGALTQANTGWDTGYNDIGLWWTVIACLLAIAATGAIVGTWIHTQSTEG